ncbi:MAG: hypothetical protein K2X77_06975 [Candidatus Obscuribacterales bacterium]|jgi:hypothetical protein|nr:hypothetical protein [Candidatus Obscuribacterales bacterium]
MEGFYIMLETALNKKLFKTLGVHTMTLDNSQYMIARMSAEEVEHALRWPMEQIWHWAAPIMPYDEQHSLR